MVQDGIYNNHDFWILMDGMTINHFWWVLTTAHMMPYSEYDAKLMQNNEPRDQNSVQCPENGRSLLTVVFMSKLLLKFSASGWSTEVQKNCSPPMSAAPVKVAIYAWIVCRYAAMPLCRYAAMPLTAHSVAFNLNSTLSSLFDDLINYLRQRSKSARCF